MTQKNDIAAKAIAKTRLLRYPVCIQLRHYGGPVSTSHVQSPSSFQTFHLTLPSIHILVSELRLQAILKAVNVITHVFGNTADSLGSLTQAPSASSSISENVLAETNVYIQSIGVYFVPEDNEECLADSSSFRDNLEKAITSFINHLSCMDFEHPCQQAVTCTSRLLLENLSILGIPDLKAKKCVESAMANFRREAWARFHHTSSNHILGRTNRSNAKASFNFRPETLSDALDQIVRNSTLLTIAELGDCIPTELDSELAVEAESFSISLPDRRTLNASVKSLRIRSRQVTLVNVHRNDNSTKISRLPSASDGTDVALIIMLRDSSTGSYGISFEADCVDSTFDPDVYLDLIKACSPMIVVSSTNDGSVWRSSHHRAMTARDAIVHGNISSFSLVLTENLLPFVECTFLQVVIEKQTIGSRTTAPTFQAASVTLDCVSTPSYSNIVSTYSSPDGEEFNANHALRLTAHRIIETNAHDFTVALDGVRITLLRQLLNDVVQYLSSPNHGLGSLLSRLGLEADGGDRALAPSKLNLIVANSSIILPRDSTSVDLVGIEVDEIQLTHEQVADTWSIDDCFFLDGVAGPLQGKRQNGNLSSSESFFECINENNVNDTPASIPRIAVSVLNAHIFTALSKRHFSTEKMHMPTFLTCVRNTGRAEQGKPSFSVCGEISESMAEDFHSRTWEKVTREPLNLGIKVDHAHILRVLIEDINYVNSRGICVGMRMSQLYLLMSVWFANNKELPVIFPYEKEVVEKLSSDPCPPIDWPEYGTSEFVERLKRGSATTATYEMAICLTNLSWKCEYDHRNYFAKVPSSMSMMQPSGSEEDTSCNFISVALSSAVCRITSDIDSLQRIAVGATSMHILDGRQSEATFERGMFTEQQDYRSAFVDLNWGIDCSCHTLMQGLPLPFQTTVFLTPDMRCMINLGIGMAEAALVDLSPIWILLDYFGLYFKESEYGHPAFEAKLMLRENMDESAAIDFLKNIDNSYHTVDFRLWLINPNLIIPSSSEACLMLEAGGFFYRYISVDDNYSSQDIVANDLGIILMSEFIGPSKCRGLRHISGSLSSCGIKTLVDEMSFSMRYDFNAHSNYTRFSLRVPLSPQHFDRRSMDGIECLNAVVDSFSVPSPSVCKPFVVPTRDMGLHEGSIFFSYEYMRLALDLLTAFPGPFQLDELCTSDKVSQIYEMDGLTSEKQFSISAHVQSVKCVICDPVMGMHRPFLSVCLPSMYLNTSQLQDIKRFPREEQMDFQLSIEVRLSFFSLPFSK